MREMRVFVSGVRSAYELSPSETKHEAHFVTPAKVEHIDFQAKMKLSSSWREVATCQKKSFDNLIATKICKT